MLGVILTVIGIAACLTGVFLICKSGDNTKKSWLGVLLMIFSTVPIDLGILQLIFHLF